MNGMRNPHFSAMARDITDAILKTQAIGGASATYWSQEEQETCLVAAYEKWQKKGGVWTMAASKVCTIIIVLLCRSSWLTHYIQTHLNQLAHVQKGCLACLHQDICSNGSCIEGSHKGWNSWVLPHWRMTSFSTRTVVSQLWANIRLCSLFWVMDHTMSIWSVLLPICGTPC